MARASPASVFSHWCYLFERIAGHSARILRASHAPATSFHATRSRAADPDCVRARRRRTRRIRALRSALEELEAPRGSPLAAAHRRGMILNNVDLVSLVHPPSARYPRRSLRGRWEDESRYVKLDRARTRTRRTHSSVSECPEQSLALPPLSNRPWAFDIGDVLE